MLADGKIHFHCPHCNKSVGVGREHAGKRGKCTGCGKVIDIPTADAEYLQDCFDLHLVERPDPCHWSELPGAKPLVTAGNSKDWSETIRLATTLIQSHGNHGFGYYWLAEAHRALTRHDLARQVLLQGLARASLKYMLCLEFGDVEWDLSNLNEAVRWWIKSVVVQSRAKKLRDHCPFLYLSYVAEGLGLEDACSALRRQVDDIKPGQIRLDPGPAERLITTAQLGETVLVRQAIERLYQEFLRNASKAAETAMAEFPAHRIPTCCNCGPPLRFKYRVGNRFTFKCDGCGITFDETIE